MVIYIYLDLYLYLYLLQVQVRSLPDADKRLRSFHSFQVNTSKSKALKGVFHSGLERFSLGWDNLVTEDNS